MFYVYVIYNQEANRFYIGQTEDLIRRIRQHNEHVFKGYTARYRGEWKLIYEESLSTRSDALKREKQLKSGNGREFVKTLIPA